jgi:8-oxo-dGTP pyrophosphatase MutT (NUDIX family)
MAEQSEVEIIHSVGVAVFKDAGTAVLLVRHNRQAGHVEGTYGFPAGRLNPGETEKTAAARELAEETGLVTEEKYLVDFPGNFFGPIKIPRSDGTEKNFTIRIFICQNHAGILREENPETTSEWIKVSKLSDYNLLPSVAAGIQNALTFLSQ